MRGAVKGAGREFGALPTRRSRPGLKTANGKRDVRGRAVNRAVGGIGERKIGQGPEYRNAATG